MQSDLIIANPAPEPQGRNPSSYSVRPFRAYAPGKSEASLPSFSTYKAIVIEIGAGAGWHAIEYAKAHPQHYLIALEKTNEKSRHLKNRLLSHDLKNIYAIQNNAMSWIPAHIGNNQIDQYFILYPNPHPKKRQQNLRWHRMPFMRTLIETLKLGGQITLATNQKFYAQEAVYWMAQIWKLQLIQNLEFNWDSRPEGYPRTHFEKKYLLRSESCWNLIFQKA